MVDTMSTVGEIFILIRFLLKQRNCLVLFHETLNLRKSKIKLNALEAPCTTWWTVRAACFQMTIH